MRWVTLVALGLCGLAVAAPLGVGRAGMMRTSDDAPIPGSSSQELPAIDQAELAALPARAQVVLVKVLGRMELLRAEIADLRADKLRSDERARSAKEQLELQLAACVARHEADITASRHRKQVAKAPCDARTLAVRTDAVMNACCPFSGGGHRRLQADCALPDTCPSATCAASFVEYYDDCQSELREFTTLPLSDFADFYASCQELQAGAGQMLQGQRVFGLSVVTDEGAAISGAMFVSRQLAHVEPLGSLDPLEPLTPPAAPKVDELASMMPTLLQPCNATYAVDLQYDVSPAEVQVVCEKDVTIRAAVTLGRSIQYGGVNRAFFVTDTATLHLERIEISDRTFTHTADMFAGRDGDAGGIITVWSGEESGSPPTVYLTECTFARNPYRVLMVKRGMAVVTRSIFIDNIVSEVLPETSWWEAGMKAPYVRRDHCCYVSEMEGAVIFAKTHSQLFIDSSRFQGNGLRSTQTINPFSYGGSCTRMQGGAVSFHGVELEISDTAFEHNTFEITGCDAQLQGGGRSYMQQGAAVYIGNGNTVDVPINISQCTFLDNAPENSVWWNSQLLQPCADYDGDGTSCTQDTIMCTGNILDADGNPRGQRWSTEATGQYVHGGHDVCHACENRSPASGASCPAQSRMSSWWSSSPPECRRDPRADNPDCFRALIYYGRALDDGPEPQSMGWWYPGEGRSEGRRLNLKAEATRPTDVPTLRELQTTPTFQSIDDMMVDEDVDKFSDDESSMLLTGEE